MFGYIQVYFKIIGKEDTYYAKISTNFKKPIIEEFLTSVKNLIKEAYEKLDEIQSIDFCTKEEYEQSDCEEIIKYRFTSEDKKECMKQ